MNKERNFSKTSFVNSNKKQFIDFKKKLTILDMLDSVHSIRKTAEHFKVSKGTIQGVKEKRLELKTLAERGDNLKRGRMTKESPSNIILYRWFTRARSFNYPISGPILRIKALQIAQGLGISDEDFMASEGWLHKFKTRHNIKEHKISGESCVIDLSTVNEYKEILQMLLKDYEPCDVFNMDETGYFFRAIPDHTLAQSNDKCKGGKQGKDRLTIVLTCSASGEKIPPLIIGKSKKPRAFSGVDLSTLGCTYGSSTKAWMTISLFQKYLISLDEYFRKRKRKILLFLDNAPVHVLDEKTKLTNITLKYLPPNLTCVLQPIDGGIIRSLKALARKFQIVSLLGLLESDTPVHEIVKTHTVLDAINNVVKAWSQVKPKTITKCFKNCGFFTESDVPEALVEVDDDITNLIDVAKMIGISSENLVLEENIHTSDEMAEDKLLTALIEDFLDEGKDSSEEENGEDNMKAKIENDKHTIDEKFSEKYIKSKIQELIRYAKANNLSNDKMHLEEFYWNISKLENEKMRQMSITEFFVKK